MLLVSAEVIEVVVVAGASEARLAFVMVAGTMALLSLESVMVVVMRKVFAGVVAVEAVVMDVTRIGEVTTHGFVRTHKPYSLRADFSSLSTNWIIEEVTTRISSPILEVKVTTIV